MAKRVALITGASRGIGQAIAQELGKSGAILYLTQHRQTLEETLSTLEGTECHTLEGDVCASSFAAEAIAKIKKEQGRLDILINAAGITRDGLALRMKEEDLRQVMEVNFSASALLTREALRLMLPKRWGRVVSIGSVVGLRANPGQANYAASKAALAAFTMTVAKEVASRHITLNVIAPGFIETEMTAKLTPLQKENVLQNIPMRTFGRVRDVASLACFLCSEEAAYITGQTFVVDGGLTL